MTPEAGRYLDKAGQSLARARAILNIEPGEDAGRAAYLAALHAAQALIFERTAVSPRRIAACMGSFYAW